MLNPTDVSAFTLSYTQLYICYSSVIGYQITLANGGCLDPSLGADNRVQLISNGAIHSDSATTAFQTATNTLTNTASSIAAGVSFEAFPLTGTPQVYTVHAKVLVSSNGKKRDTHLDAVRPHATVCVPPNQQVPRKHRRAAVQSACTLDRYQYIKVHDCADTKLDGQGAVMRWRRLCVVCLCAARAAEL